MSGESHRARVTHPRARRSPPLRSRGQLSLLRPGVDELDTEVYAGRAGQEGSRPPREGALPRAPAQASPSWKATTTVFVDPSVWIANSRSPACAFRMGQPAIPALRSVA